MAINIKSTIENTKEITLSDSTLTALMDIERVLDTLNCYVFKNWKLGEIIEGPIFEKYFVTIKAMWPYRLMPDPRGGEQLLIYNCEVTYQKEKLEFPIKPKSMKDFKPGTKIAKTKKVPIWIVSITMPRKLIADIQKGIIEVEGEKLDMAELSDSFDTGVDEEEFNQSEQQPEQQQPNNMMNNMGGL